MKWFRSIFLSFLLLMASSQVLAKGYLETVSGLYFEIPDGFVEQVKGVENVQSVLSRVVFSDAGKSGSPRSYEIQVKSQDLGTVLTELQLRVINTVRKSNLDLLGSTAIRLDGQSFLSSEEMVVVVAMIQQGTLVISSRGNSESEIQSFLQGIEKAGVFTDLGRDELRSEIETSFEKGIFDGYLESGRRVFRPNTEIDRASFMKVVCLSAPGVSQAQIDEFFRTNRSQKGYTDVPESAWFAAYIQFASSKGWVQGYDDGSFRPEQPINLAEATKIILKANGISVSPDEQVWFRPYVQAFEDRNILVQGAEQVRFSFGSQPFFLYEPVKRSQVAGLLVRLIQSEEHPYRVFGIQQNLAQLPLQFTGAEKIDVLELGAGPKSLGAWNRYLLGRANTKLATLLIFDPGEWERRERDGQISGLIYLGETKEKLFALAGAAELQNQFLLLDQDLFSFDDGNVSFRFLASSPFRTSVDTSGGREQVTVMDEDGNEKLSFSRFPKRAADAQRYQGKDPLRSLQLGSRTWYVYEESVGNQVRVILTAEMKGDLLLASFRLTGPFVQLDAETAQILRTLAAR